MDRVRESAKAGMQPYDPKYLPAQAYLSANENSSDVPPSVRRAIAERLSQTCLNRYPDPLANTLREQIAAANGLSMPQILIGNGGDELLFNLALAWGGPGRAFLNFPPTFSVYENNARLTNTCVVDLPRNADYSLDEEAVLDRISSGDIDYLIITSPNNPTGNGADPDFVLEVLKSTDALVLVDEAYCEFSGTTMLPHLREHRNLAILRTFSKAYSLAGVRLGYVLAHEDVVTELIKVRQPYSVDAVSQVIGSCLFEQRDAFAEGIAEIIRERAYLQAGLSSIDGVEAYPSEANFILFKVGNAADVWQRLYAEGILIRDFSHAPYLENRLRVTVGSHEENEAFLTALRRAVLADQGGLS